MKCYECKWLDRTVVLTSYPPQYRCTLGFGSHCADHECEYEFMPVVRCEDCKYLGIKDFVYDCKKNMVGVVKPEYFCSYGERKEK